MYTAMYIIRNVLLAGGKWEGGNYIRFC